MTSEHVDYEIPKSCIYDIVMPHEHLRFSRFQYNGIIEVSDNSSPDRRPVLLIHIEIFYVWLWVYYAHVTYAVFE